MKSLNWSPEKNKVLKNTRGISFEEIALLIEAGDILDVLDNPGHQEQFIYILDIENYAVVVPFIETKDEIFLKTAFPSRKYTKLYIDRGYK